MNNLKQTLETLTTLEKAVLTIMSQSDFETTWLTYYDEIDYNTTEFNKNQISGIVSSLHKKGLVVNDTTEDYEGLMLPLFASDNFEDVEDEFDMTEQIEEFLQNN